VRLRGGRTRQRPRGGDDHLHEHRRGESPARDRFDLVSAQRSANGLNTEAKRLLLAHAFEDLGAIAVEFRTHFFNHASRHAIERLGALLDGVLRSHQINAHPQARGSLRDTCVKHHRPRVADGASPSRPPTRPIRARLRRALFRIVFFSPRIAPNTGNAIRMVAATGCELHLVEPMGSTCPNPLRRAGLDYHDLASVTVHPSLEAVVGDRPARVFAFTARRSLLRRHRLPTR
jgi:hypothetical protein